MNTNLTTRTFLFFQSKVLPEAQSINDLNFEDQLHLVVDENMEKLPKLFKHKPKFNIDSEFIESIETLQKEIEIEEENFQKFVNRTVNRRERKNPFAYLGIRFRNFLDSF